MLVNYFAVVLSVILAVLLVHQDVSAAAPTTMIPTQKPTTFKPSVKLIVPTQVNHLYSKLYSPIFPFLFDKKSKSFQDLTSINPYLLLYSFHGLSSLLVFL